MKTEEISKRVSIDSKKYNITVFKVKDGREVTYICDFFIGKNSYLSVNYDNDMEAISINSNNNKISNALGNKLLSKGAYYINKYVK